MEITTLILKNPVILISLIALIFFKLYPPKSINSWYGYRTANSKKNNTVWVFAQKYSANLSLSLVLIIFIFQFFLYLKYGSTALIDLSIVGVWLLVMVLVILKTESKLKVMNKSSSE